MRDLGPYFWFRVVMMGITLTVVISIIYKLNNPGSKGLIDMLAGLDSGSKVTLCPTRVSSVSVIGQAALFQEGMKWYRAGEQGRQELDHLSVERWFSEYCTVPAEPAAEPGGQSQPVLTLAYVAGTPVTIQFSEAGVFSLEGKFFRSLKLEEAITAISNLPVAAQPAPK